MPLKTAIIGFSKSAEELHVPALRSLKDKFVLSAITDPSAERLDKASKAVKGVGLYPDENSLFEKESLDLAVITGEAGKNPVLKALNRNLHVLCEGPLLLGLSELDELLDKSRQRGKLIYFFDWWKRHPQVKAMQDAIAQDIIGKPDFFQWSAFFPGEAETAGRELWTAFHILNLLSGRNPVTACAKFYDGGRSDITINFLDASAQLHLNGKSRLQKICALISGEKGLLQLNDDSLAIERAGLGRKIADFGKKFAELRDDPALAAGVYLELEEALRESSLAEKNMKAASLCLRLISSSVKSGRSGKPVPV
ncbi:MAG: hypothetical protein COT17_05735 [Elusimicrobia bacterium CG08_land_8_20_14_0_20_51_18]|nr:MAG: hypothetical protein COT17_05735 [Elusimicrobia bacterium CG08_land_8_20_14_0_20_51_18]